MGRQTVKAEMGVEETVATLERAPFRRMDTGREVKLKGSRDLCLSLAPPTAVSFTDSSTLSVRRLCGYNMLLKVGTRGVNEATDLKAHLIFSLAEDW